MTKLDPSSTSRRQTLQTLLRAGGAALFIPAWNETIEAADTLTCVATTPIVTEGPYWVDEKLFRSDIRTDPSTGAARTGVPLTVVINVQNLSGTSCTPLAGAYVDIWHCDAKGIYSDEPTYNPGGGTGSVNTTGQKFLRGYQITDANGQVTFTTIYPGWYSGRTIHIHVRVRTYSGSNVLSNFVSQIFYDDSLTDIILTTNGYLRSTVRDTNNANDMVYNVANNTRMLATATGSLGGGFTSTITMGAPFVVPTAGVPSISTGGVANAVSGIAGIASGAWISIYGSSLAASARTLATTDLANNIIPTALGGVSVQINNKAAYVQYISPTQVNVLAPPDTSLGTVNVQVTNSAGASNVVTATLVTFLPGLSVLSSYVRAVRYPDNVIINGTGTAEAGYTTSAAVAQGGILSLFGTGFGPTNPAETPGAVFSGALSTTNTVTVTIGGLPAAVSFAGLVGPGLYQINVTVPTGLADGDHAVVATVGGVSSQSIAYLKVAASAKVSARFPLTKRTVIASKQPFAPLNGDPCQWVQQMIGMPARQVAENMSSGAMVQLA